MNSHLVLLLLIITCITVCSFCSRRSCASALPFPTCQLQGSKILLIHLSNDINSYCPFFRQHSDTVFETICVKFCRYFLLHVRQFQITCSTYFDSACSKILLSLQKNHVKKNSCCITPFNERNISTMQIYIIENDCTT